MNKAVIYARYSSSSQDAQTIEMQLKKCRDFADKNELDVIDEYIDEAKTGRNSKRNGLQRIIKDSEKGNFKYVIIYMSDRYFRNTLEALTLENDLKQCGITLLYTNENFKDDAQGRFARVVGYAVNQYQSDIYAQKITDGLKENADKFLSTGGQRTLGLKVDDKKFYIDEAEAVIVRKIYQMYADGHSRSEMLDYLNASGYKTAKGGEFKPNSLHNILTNKRYIGTYIFKGIETPDILPRIIDDKLFYEVQEMVEKNKKARARNKYKNEEYLLTTKLYCGNCKEMMTGDSGKSSKYFYYKCKGRRAKTCKKETINKDYLEELVCSVARNVITDENINNIATIVVDIVKKDRDNTALNRIKNALRDNKRKKDNLTDAVAESDNSATRRTFYEKIEQLDKMTKELEKELIKEESKYLSITIPQVKEFLKKLRKGSVNNIKYKKMLIDTIVNKVYLYEDKAIIIFNTQDKEVEVEVELFEEPKSSDITLIAPPKDTYTNFYYFVGGFAVKIKLENSSENS